MKMTEQILLPEKKAGSRILDALMISGVAVGSAVLLKPVVGNNNFLSGGVKMAGGLVSSGLGKGKATEIIGAGLMIDGATDLINSFFSGHLGKMSGSSDTSSGSVFI